MNIFSWAFSATSQSTAEVPSVFTLALRAETFIRADILQTYSKILTDVAERTHGLEAKQEKVLWDSCVQTDANQGLITLLAVAMTDLKELFLVYKTGTDVLRVATADEEKQIKADYKANAQSKIGVYISFKDYRRTEMLKIYSSFEYCVLASLNKSLNLEKSIQFKINDLRSSVSLVDSSLAKTQAQAIATAMGNGNDVMLDSKDTVECATPDTTPTEKAITFLDGKRAFILGLPLSYIVGEQTAGIGSTGEADMRAVERGLRQYFVSIIQPVFKAVFGKETEFKTQDFRQVSTGLETLKSFDLTSDEYLSKESKREITARVFDLDPEEEAKRIASEEKEREKEAEALLTNQEAAGLINPPGTGVAPPRQAVTQLSNHN